MTTTTDNKLDNVREHVKESIKNLSDILIEKCDGYDDLVVDYRHDLHRILVNLNEANYVLNHKWS